MSFESTLFFFFSIRWNFSDKVPDFISLLARVLGTLVYALVTGWKPALVFLSVSPFLVILFNVTVKVRIPRVLYNKFSMIEIVIQVIMKYTIKEIQAFASASTIAQEVLQKHSNSDSISWPNKRRRKVSYFSLLTSIGKLIFVGFRFAKNLIAAKRIGVKKGLYRVVTDFYLSGIYNHILVMITMVYHCT